MRISDWSSDVCSSDLWSPSPKGEDRQRPLPTPKQSLRERALPLHALAHIVALIFAAIPPRLFETRLDVAAVGKAPRGPLRVAGSEELRVGTDFVSTFRSRWCPAH